MGFPASPRGLLTCFLTLPVLRLGSAEFRVVGPGHPLRAAVGQDIVLPCHLSPGMDARSLDIRWIRHRFSETVHHYHNGEDLYGEQMRDYDGRTELVRDGLSGGNLDLRILELRPSDDGQYICNVQDGASYGEAVVELEVAATGSVPQLSLEAYEDGGIRVVCRSAGWYPQPEVLWKGPGGQHLPSLSQTRSSDERGLSETEDAIIVSGNGGGDLSCVVRSSRLKQEQESSLRISAPFFHNARPWMAALGVFLVLSVVLTGLSAYLFRRKALQSRELEERDAALGDHGMRSCSLSSHIAFVVFFPGKQNAALAWRQFLLPQNPDVVTLDPNMAHSQLVLSEDLRRVRWESAWRDLPDTPERFIYWRCVLGREGFREGRHCWEVEVEGKVGGDSWWGVGVARDSVERKRLMDLSPETGIWAVGNCYGPFMSLTSPPTPLSLSLLPRRIWVCLDCTQGLVTFINAHSGGEIFTFPPASFNGDIIRPWFQVETKKTQLCLRGSTPQTLPPSIPTTAPHSPCPSPPTARSPLLHAAGADVPPCPAQAQAAEGE
ncbi:LOW QUALITY PROTEIN: butyrophilin subfamily 1 member A1-like [Phoenicopterus ruber ruber]